MSDLFYSGNDTIYHLSTGTASFAGSMLTPYVNGVYGKAGVTAAGSTAGNGKTAGTTAAEGTAGNAQTAGKTAGKGMVTKPAVAEAAGETADDALEQFYDDIFESSYGEQFDPVKEQAIAGPGKIGEIGTNPSVQINGNSYDINQLQKTQPYIYPETVSSIKQTIAQNGPNSVPPIEIRVHNGQVLVVDGHHRLEAFRQLGYDRVPIRYLHSSQLGKNFSDGTYYRSIQELLDAVEISN